MLADFISGGAFSTTRAGVGGSGANVTLTTSNATHQYFIDGLAYTKAAISVATPSTDAYGNAVTISRVPTGVINGVQTYSGAAKAVLWLLDAAGAVSWVASSNTALWDGSTAAPNYGFNSNSAPAIPAIPDGYAPFGLTIFKVASTVVAPITIGTSNWNTAGLTVVHKDLGFIPPRPVLA